MGAPTVAAATVELRRMGEQAFQSYKQLGLEGGSLGEVTVWLHQARRRIAFTLFPMLFVLTITLWSLTRLTIANLNAAKGIDMAFLNAVSAAALTALALFLVASAIGKLRGERVGSLAPGTQ